MSAVTSPKKSGPKKRAPRKASSSRPRPRRAARRRANAIVRASFSASIAAKPLTIEAPAGASVATFIDQVVAERPGLRRFLVAHIDGTEVPVEAWAETKPRAGQALTLAVRPGHGDTAASVLRTVLTIAVIAVAAWIGAGGLGAAFAAGSIQASLAAAGVAVAGNLAINALVPVRSPQISTERPPAFLSVTGGSNQAQLLKPFPIVLGTHRYYPPLWSQYVQETAGEDIYIRFVLALGYGPFVASEVKIGETDIADYGADVELEWRLNPDDPPHTIITGDPSQTTVGTKLTTDYVTQTTPAGVDEIAVVYGFREGLGALDSKGRKASTTVNVALEYRRHGSADPWSSLRPNVPQSNGAAATAGADSRTTFDADGGSYSGYQTALSSSGASSGDIAYTRSDPGRGFQTVERWAVPRGQYDVRTRRTGEDSTDTSTADGVWFEYLQTVKVGVDPFPLRRVASLGVRIKATGALQGVVDAVNLVGQAKMPVFSDAARDDPDAATAADLSGSETSRNCAELLLHIYRGPFNADPRPDDAIDWPSLAAFSAYCRDNNLHYDEPIVDNISRGELARRICAAAGARPLDWNGKLSVVIDRQRDAEPPAQVFSARTVRNFKWTKTFPAPFHAVQVQFANELNGYQADEVTVYLPGYDESNATLIQAFDLPGKTNPDEIRTVVLQYIKNSFYQTERFTFDQDAESLVARFGQKVRLQHDVMVTGLGSAKVASVIPELFGQVTGFTLDEPIDLQGETSLGIFWRTINATTGEMSSPAELAVTAAAPLTGEDGVRTFTFTSRAATAAPAVGELVLLGVTGEVALDCLVQNMEPVSGFDAGLTLIPYAAERFSTAPTWPPHDPKTTLPLRPRPATPQLLSVTPRSRELVLSFNQPNSPRGVQLMGFRGWVRETGSPADSWTKLADLSATDRQLIAPAGDPAAHYDLMLTAIGTDAGGNEVVSDPLIAADYAAQSTVALVKEPTADFSVEISPLGVKQVVLKAAWTPAEDPEITTTRLEILLDGDPEDPDATWAAFAEAPAKTGALEVHGVQVGRSYTFGFSNVTRRNAVSARVVLDAIDAPDVLVSGGSTGGTVGIPHGTTLPGSGSEGDLFRLDTDGRLYIWHDGGWEPVVGGFGPVGIPRIDIGDFPDSPTDGELVWDGTRLWMWDATASGGAGAWVHAVADLPDGTVGIEKFSSAPTTGNTEGRVYLNTSDGRIYRFHSGAWTAETPAASISGTITSTQIGANSIATAAIQAGAVTASQIAAHTITAGNIVAGTITASEIASATITATQIAVNTITAGNIASRTITADRIVVGAITASEIAANTIVAGNIAANTITGDRLVVGTITTTEIAANTITAGDIAAHTITAGEIAASTITATQIAANTITADRMNVSSLSAITANLGSITAGSIQSTDGNAGFNLNAQFLFFTAAGKSYRIGNSVGAGLQWFGPSSVGFGSETTSNGYWVLGFDGVVYYGGSPLQNGGSLSCSMSPGGVSGTGDSGTVSTGSMTVSVSGGSGSYTINWIVTDGAVSISASGNTASFSTPGHLGLSINAQAVAFVIDNSTGRLGQAVGAVTFNDGH